MTNADFWKDADVISTYTRAQAHEDGMLTPVTDLVPDELDFAAQAGWKIPVDLTATLANIVIPSKREADECYQDVKGRLWDVLNMARVYGSGRAHQQEVRFPTIFWLIGRSEYGRKAQRTLHLKVRVGPGDNGEPVALMGLASEDLA